MLKKLTALSLSLLLCLSLLPGQAGAMDAPENESLVQAENVENLGSSGDNDAGDAPDHVVKEYSDGNWPGSGLGGGIGAGDGYGGGGTWGPGGGIGGVGGGIGGVGGGH